MVVQKVIGYKSYTCDGNSGTVVVIHTDQKQSLGEETLACATPHMHMHMLRGGNTSVALGESCVLYTSFFCLMFAVIYCLAQQAH